MDDKKRRELGERLLVAVRSQSDLLVPDVLDGVTMRATLEWARKATGQPWLSVCAAALGPGWVVVDDCGVVEGCDHLHDTEAEAHVALAEWAAEGAKCTPAEDDGGAAEA